MRCLLLCSGAGEPTPVGASVQSLPSGNNRPRFCCPAREHRSPPCAKGGQHGRAMQGGLQSQANDSAGCCDRVREHRLTVRTPDREHRLAVPTRDREHRLAVPTRDREHRLGAAARRQSLSRRSPTAPFAQGRLLCCPGNNRPRFCCPARQRSMAVAARHLIWGVCGRGGSLAGRRGGAGNKGCDSDCFPGHRHPAPAGR